jgi:DNA-binding YbaB/EbfC family protein
MSSIGKLMKQAARMQQQMEQIQSALAQRTVEATSGGGAVKVVAKCDGTIAAVKIDPQAVNPADAQLLEDMILPRWGKPPPALTCPASANRRGPSVKGRSSARPGSGLTGSRLPLTTPGWT